MKRPRIKCARCGKRRVPPRGVNTVRCLMGRNIYLEVRWNTHNTICSQCNKVIEKLMFTNLYENI